MEIVGQISIISISVWGIGRTSRADKTFSSLSGISYEEDENEANDGDDDDDGDDDGHDDDDGDDDDDDDDCLLYTSPSPRDYAASRMPSSA